MRHSESVRLHRLIIHFLGGERPEICDDEIPLQAEGRLEELITRHICQALDDAAARTARFDGAPHELSPLCDAMLSGQVDFVDGSRQLARRLHGILRGDGRISPGDLVVGLYHIGVGEAAFPCLALIKMNPSEVFRQDYVQGEDGRHRMKITLLDQVLPTERERLQKCACIRHTGQEYDMILLDRQIRSQAVARFFTVDFLQACLALDDGQRTTRFYDCAGMILSGTAGRRSREVE